MQLTNFITLALTLATTALAAPTDATLEPRQSLNTLLCPLLGTPICSAQCQLILAQGGQCSPSNECFCFDGTKLQLLSIPGLGDDDE